MKSVLIIKQVFLISVAIFLLNFPGQSQNLENFKIAGSSSSDKSAINQKIQFNGYTNHWQDNYTQWIRYGNLFKMAVPDVQPTILQSKINIAEDIGLPGLLMQEGFVSKLFSKAFTKLLNPSQEELLNEARKGNVLVVTGPGTDLGRQLENKAKAVFGWVDNLPSHQLKAAGLEKIKAFFLADGERSLFVVSSASQDQAGRFLDLIDRTNELLDRYDLYKGWFGAATLLKSVTCTPGHPLEVIGKGMNEGNTWFIFDGYMDFLAKDELKKWMEEVNNPAVANVGFSPVYGCRDYDGLQVQDMQTKQAWIDFAHKKGGYAFRPVYDPDSDAFQFDGYIAQEGNKEQIDNENVPFISKTGSLIENLTSSMMLFIDKGKPLSDETIWEAIMSMKEVAILEEAKMMGPALYRNALQLLYLDRDLLEDYFSDRLDMEAVFNGYDLIVTLRNYYPGEIAGTLEIVTSGALRTSDQKNNTVTLPANGEKQIKITLKPVKEAMGRANPVAVHFSFGEKKKSTLTVLDLPPAISMHKLLYSHAPNVDFPVTIHNFSEQKSFPVELDIFEKSNLNKPVLHHSKSCEAQTGKVGDMLFSLQLKPGEYIIKASTLGLTYESQLGVGRSEGKPYLYEVDLNSDGINEYRMENDSVQVTLLRTGARVIEYIVKSKKDNVLFKIWPKKTYNDKRPFRKRGFYPFGGFEDFLGQASMETHKIYDAKVIRDKGDYVQVEMDADYYGNKLKKIFTLYGNSPLLEVRFELIFQNPEANVIGPQPILELGEKHWTEDVFTVPTMDGLKEYRMRPEQYYGQAINAKEGWNAGYDTKDNISFVGAFPVTQPIFLHMWMNHPDNAEAPHYYVEFQPWTPIVQKTTMYFSYYLWGSSGPWQNALQELRIRNLITSR